MPERIMIVGCPGSGKSTLARAICAKTGLPVVHLDKLNWRDNWTSIPREEFDMLLQAEIDKPRWIIDGNYTRTIAMRLQRADTVLWLDYPTPICLWGVLKRIATTRGAVRPDMGPNCPERFDLSFIKYVLTYRKTVRPKLEKLIAPPPGCTLHRLRSRREALNFLASLQHTH